MEDVRCSVCYSKQRGLQYQETRASVIESKGSYVDRVYSMVTDERFIKSEVSLRCE